MLPPITDEEPPDASVGSALAALAAAAASAAAVIIEICSIEVFRAEVLFSAMLDNRSVS